MPGEKQINALEISGDYATGLGMMQSQAGKHSIFFFLLFLFEFPPKHLCLNRVLSFKAEARFNPQLFYSFLNTEQDSQRECCSAASVLNALQ